MIFSLDFISLFFFTLSFDSNLFVLTLSPSVEHLAPSSSYFLVSMICCAE